jgi:hypothetical protein
MGSARTSFSVITGFMIFMGFLEAPFYRIQTSKPVPAAESINAFSVISHDAKYRLESAPFSEPNGSSLTEDELIFWQVSVPSGLFFFFISLVLLQLFLLRSWNSEDKTTKKMKQLQMIIELCESSIRSREDEAQNKQYYQLQNEIESLRELTEVRERRLAMFQNALYLVKTVNDVDKHCPQLRNYLDIIANKIKSQDKRRTEICSRIATLTKSRR